MKASLHIQTSCRGDITYLKKSYCTQPLKVANITEDKKDRTLRLMLMSSSPGILDGDEYEIKIELEKNSSLHLSTQSFQRLFTMKQGASQHLQVNMAEDSSFCFLPHPSVPHNQSIFSATNNIYLSDCCSLIWGEVLTCGRKLSGEAFQFSKFHNVTKIFVNGRLVIKENLLVQPLVMDVQSIGQLEGFTHQAGLIYLNEQANVSEISAIINNYLSEQWDILYGITATSVNGLMIRLLGQKGEQLHECLKEIARLLPIQKTKEVEYAN